MQENFLNIVFICLCFSLPINFPIAVCEGSCMNERKLTKKSVLRVKIKKEYYRIIFQN